MVEYGCLAVFLSWLALGRSIESLSLWMGIEDAGVDLIKSVLVISWISEPSTQIVMSLAPRQPETKVVRFIWRISCHQELSRVEHLVINTRSSDEEIDSLWPPGSIWCGKDERGWNEMHGSFL